MSEILFLSHRIPYPPDKGDKIRSYHLLRALAERHTVHLGTFVDDPADWAHVEAVQRLCGGETCIRPLMPRAARLRSAAGLLTGEPLTLAYYRDRELRRWVRNLGTRRTLAGVVAFSSSMGQYAEQVALPAGARRVMDFCDVDSDKWAQYAVNHSQPLKLVYAREARTLAATESRYVRDFDATLVISDAEAQILRRVADSGAERIRIFANGVDTEYFDPGKRFADPFAPGAVPIVFTGAMDYHANVDGVCWFAREVFPAVRHEVPSATFAIVGSNPAPEVTSLAKEPGVLVTRRVPDIRPYLAHAACVVAPLRLARGVQNKILEALAMARPVVATLNAVQGIPAAKEAGVRVPLDAADFAASIVESVSRPVDPARGRAFVVERYGWQCHLQQVSVLFDREAKPGSSHIAAAAAVA